jgi:hypothetical protein
MIATLPVSPLNGAMRALAICAQFVPEDVASGDLSDSVDFGISNLRVINTRLRFDPSRHHENK